MITGKQKTEPALPLLQIVDLETSFYSSDGLVPVIDHVSFSINTREKVALVGESGSGKSVASYSIMGILGEKGKITKGNIFFQQTDLAKLSDGKFRQLRGKEMAMIFQEPLTALNPLLRIGTQITEMLIQHRKLPKKKAKQDAIELLREVGFSKPETSFNQYPHQLSGGMRQRAMIAMAISCKPKLLIADEATTALDVTLQAQILRMLSEISEKEQMAILFISHDLAIVAEFADRVVVMYAGQVVETSDVITLLHDPKHPYTKALLKSTISLDTNDTRLNVIDGSVPSPEERGTGCRFYPRCPNAMPVCAKTEPPAFQAGPSSVKCWLFDEKEIGGDGQFEKYGIPNFGRRTQ